MKVMLAHKMNPKRVVFPVYMEPKLDGFRVLVSVGARVKFCSRLGNVFTSLAHYESDFKMLAATLGQVLGKPLGTVWFDGEVVTGDFAKTSSEVRRKDVLTEQAVFHIFDVQIKGSFLERTGALRKAIMRAKRDSIRLVPSYRMQNWESVERTYAKWRSSGIEGAIIKTPDHFYQDGRSYDWLKMKDMDTVTCRVTGFEEGTGRLEGMLGALVCETADERYSSKVVVRVGTGISDAMRKEIWKSPGDYFGALVDVACQAVTPAGSLRHPRFVNFRVEI